MFRKKNLLRRLALFLAINTFLQIVFPAVSYALTSGPTAPEYSSFEPVDTSDMVNLSSGDFTYNIPLLEVPGPEGGYPLSLSYHAGIKPNQDASWVGLGWSLNAGAVNRIVNGYADDHAGARRTVRDTWEGGERHTYSVGVGVGGANVGLTVANDTYQGVGVGASFGYAGARVETGPYGGVSGGMNVGIGPLSGGVNVGPDGKVHPSAALNVGYTLSETHNLGIQAGVSTNFKSVSFNSSISNGLATISSKGLKASFSVGGFTANSVNSKAGAITTEGYGFQTPPIPVGPVLIDMGYQYLRYYSDESSFVNSYGVLHANWAPSSNANDNAIDSYALLDPHLPGGIVDNPEVDKLTGGSFLAYDNYQVLGQGTGGSIQPYNFLNGTVYRQNVQEKDENGDLIPGKYHVEYLQDKPFREMNFRFKNDFSNALTYRNDLGFNFAHYTTNKLDFSNDFRQPATEEGFDSESNHLAGSKHVEWLTNEQIQNGTAYSRYGFISAERDESSVPTETLDKQIGGLMVTNESGVTYHYALPVYSYDERSYMWHYDHKDKKIDRTIENPAPYAYTWLLTGITGPDFVDRGEQGVLDEEDWGYWVEFDYGLWADNYQWRNPALGAHTDIDGKMQSYSNGKKELYYLDAVRTRSHTALFIKEIRADGKGLTKANVEESSFNSYQEGISNCETFQYYPTSLLKLNKILLFSNNDFNFSELTDIKAGSEVYDDYRVVTCQLPDNGGIYQRVFSFHKGNTVLDKFDVANLNLEGKALREVSLETDYSLAPETANSFYSSLDVDGTNHTANESVLLGKLSLNAISFNGKGGKSVLPSTRFSYDMPETEAVQSMVTFADATEVRFINAGFKEGDIVKFPYSGKMHYATLVKAKSSTSFQAVYIGKNKISSAVNPNSEGIDTKNPPFNKDAYDEWQMYKSDYVDLGDENLSRLVSDVSAKSTDAWSLREIQTPTGAKIAVQYGTDNYNDAAYYLNNTLTIKEVQTAGYSTNEFKIFFNEAIDIPATFRVGEQIDFLANLRFVSDKAGFYFLYANQGTLADRYRIFENKSGVVQVTRVDNDGIVVSSQEILSKLNEIKGIIYKEVYSGNSELVDVGYNWSNPPKLTGGNVFFPQRTNYSGGELQVTSISINSFQNNKRVNYNYENGSIPYPPKHLNNYSLALWDYESVGNHDEWDKRQKKSEDNFKKELYTNFSKLLANARELPGPQVIYQQVTVSEEVERNGKRIKIPGKKVYRFQGFEKDMVDFSQSENYARTGSHTFYKQVRVQVPCNDGESQSGTEETCYEFVDQVDKTVSTATRKIAIRDYTSKIGNLISLTTYDGKDNIVHRLTNQYLHDDAIHTDNFNSQLESRFNNQGLVTQVNNEYKVVKDEDGVYRHKVVLARREEYPNVAVRSIEEDFKTGTKRVSENLAFDFYTGQPVKTFTSDGYGNHFVSVSQPAYQVTQAGNRVYSGMGLKTAVSARHGARKNQKHMLSQQAGGYTLKVNEAYKSNPIASNILGVAGASVQSWNKHWAYRTYSDEAFGTGNVDMVNMVWRKQASYRYEPTELSADGVSASYAEFSNTPFNWQDPTANSPKWLKQAEISLYSRQSKAIEAIDQHGIYAATKLGAGDMRPIATASASRYHEMAFSGAEDQPEQFGTRLYFAGEVQVADGYHTAQLAHTGDYSLMLEQSKKGFVYQSSVEAGKAYFASAWIHRTNVGHARLYARGNGQERTASHTSATKAGDWYLFQLNIPAELTQAGSLEVGCKNVAGSSSKVFADDFRFHPLESAFSSYVYDAHTGELTYVLNNQNFFTRYYYTAGGKLAKVAQEVADKAGVAGGERVVSEFFMNYAQKPINEGLTAAFEMQGALEVGNTLTFTPKGGGYLNGSATYHWDFGDGTTKQSAGGSVKHAYQAGGVYGIRCTATFNGQSVSSTKYIEMEVEQANIVASFTESGYLYTGQEMTFTAAANSLPGTTTHFWDLGSGSFGAGGQTVRRTFTSAGTYTVRLKVENSIYGTSDIYSANVTIEQAPVVTSDFSVSGDRYPGGTVNFREESQTFPAGETTYHWNFGDGSEETGNWPSHVYSSTGTYAVTLTVANTVFGSSSTSKSVTINNPLVTSVALCVDGIQKKYDCQDTYYQNQWGSCTVTNTQIVDPSTIKISTTNLGGCGSYTYKWYRRVNGGSWSQVGTGSAFSMYLSTHGSYEIKVTVRDACGSSVTSGSQTLSYQQGCTGGGGEEF